MAEYDDREQRTEEATPRRREEARERGQVAFSSELVAALGLAAGVALLGLNGAPLARAVGGELARTLSATGSLGTLELGAPHAASLVRASITSVLGALALVVVPAALTCALAGYAQVGFRATPRAIALDPARLSPGRNLARVLGRRGLVRAVLSAAKVALITGAAALVAWNHVDDVVRAGTGELGPLLRAMGTVALRTSAAALGVIVALALVDLVFQRLQHERDLRMSRAEVREELRLTEGDPHVRARIRAIQRELATRRMMAEVPKATVVVTNPTHYAVALRYEREGEDAQPAAPVVVAKGVDHLAQRIRQLAAQHGVLCHEDVPLARTLYTKVRIGQEIPQELYGAVAAVLATVYRLKGATV